MNLTKEQVIEELYRRADLSYKLDSNQKELCTLYYTGNEKINVWLCSRRLGKTRTLLILAIEECLRKKRAIINFVAPTKIMIAAIVRPLITSILEDCPSKYRPNYQKNVHTYTFYNGSELRLAGADAGHAEKLRGGDSTAAFVDEAGSVDNLDYIVKSILLPTTLITKGKIILASTPPPDSEHEFISFCEQAELKGSLVKKTIYDNPRLSQKDIDEMTKELGGAHTEAFRRELMCELIKSSETSVIPEFNDEVEKEIVKEWTRPPFFDAYESMDLGFNDLTFVIFGYYDFVNSKVIIEDELVMDFASKDGNLPNLIKGIQEKERELWYQTDTGEVKPVYMRFSDVNPIVTAEITRASHNKLAFVNPNKWNKESSLNTLRVMISSRQIIIHPRCKNLIRHLRHVKWKNAQKIQFAHSTENGHYDGVDALAYLVKSMSYTKNPYPAHYNINFSNLHVQNPKNFYQNSNDPMNPYKKIIGFNRLNSFRKNNARQ